jgi:MYXO-CTERM domain-containing protein
MNNHCARDEEPRPKVLSDEAWLTGWFSLFVVACTLLAFGIRSLVGSEAHDESVGIGLSMIALVLLGALALAMHRRRP